jgi:hypothetical protein
MFPIPATSRWSWSASPSGRSPAVRRRAAASSRSIVSARTSGPTRASDPGLERQHGAVPEDPFELVAAQDEPGQPGPDSPGVATLDSPATRHAEVAAYNDPTFEAEQQVLAHRLDRLENAAVDAVCDAGHLPARVRRLDLQPLTDERLQPAGGAVQSIALGHR